MNKGKVYLVGAGPGDPDLLTLKAARLLRSAEVVVIDQLVSPGVLALIGPGARRIHAGKQRNHHTLQQHEINELLVSLARQGKQVVRLKGGDPFVFGRGGEECDALREAGIDVSVISGLTAGIAGPAAIGLPVTDRRHAQGVALVTGHARDGGAGPDWPALVRSGLTLVIYMGIARAAEIQRALLEAGMAVDMPVAVVSQACTPAQRHALSRLDTLQATVHDSALASPAVLVIGRVVDRVALTELLSQAAAA